MPPGAFGRRKRQRGACRAVIMSPDLILADEPTGNLDWDMSMRLLQLLIELNRSGKAVLIATHDLIRAAKQQVQARCCASPAKRCNWRGRTREKTGLKSLDLAALWRRPDRPDPAGRPRGAADRLYRATDGVFRRAMAFLAVFALALAGDRPAGRTLVHGTGADRDRARLGPADQLDEQTARGDGGAQDHARYRRGQILPDAEVEKAAEPWFGPDVPVEALPVPRLIEVTEAARRASTPRPCACAFRARRPGAVLDDHAAGASRWSRREPAADAWGCCC